MRLHIPGKPHLTYCTNIHPGESWRAIRANLGIHLPEVRRRVAPEGAMGVGLRLSEWACRDLMPGRALEEFRSFLAENDLYVFTINAFPYGDFHDRPVKTRAYEPDWTHPGRLRYTDTAAEILARLLPGGVSGSISTVPCGYGKSGSKFFGRRCAEALVRHAASLVRIERRTGKRIVLALEPEPGCYLEKTADALAFFRDELFARESRENLARWAGIEFARAEQLLRRHLGLCYDVCHAAVMFEDAREKINLLRNAGIEIPKIQLSSALRLEDGGPAAAGLLKEFDDGIYLHQTCRFKNGAVEFYPDLPEALDALEKEDGAGEWRVHCHVPLFAADFGALDSTREITADVLAMCREENLTSHLEVETYTWDVLSPGIRGEDIQSDVAREIGWVLERLNAG